MTYNPWDNSSIPEPTRSSWWSSKVFLIIVLGVAILVALVVFWNLIVSHTDDVEESNIPIIAAETITVKERPEELLVEEGDSVYGLISQEKSRSSSLKTDSEDPIYETTFSSIDQGRQEEDSIKEEKKKSFLEEKKEIGVSPILENSEHKKKSLKDDRKGSYFLQIGSLPSNQEAEQEILRLEKKHKGLKTLTMKIIPKDLENRGTYYRIVIGPFANKKEAGKISEDLKKEGLDSLITQ